MGYWDGRWVSDGRLDEIRKLAFDPVPMQGHGLRRKTCILSVPHMEGDDLEVTTVISGTDCVDSVDRYIYDALWHSSNQTIALVVPKDDVAFKPMSTWTTLVYRGRVELVAYSLLTSNAAPNVFVIKGPWISSRP